MYWLVVESQRLAVCYCLNRGTERASRGEHFAVNGRWWEGGSEKECKDLCPDLMGSGSDC